MALQLLEPMLVIVPIMLWLLVIGPLFIYPVARWRQNREGQIDPQLGLKVALHLFRMLAFQLLLLGGTLLLWTIIRKTGGRGDAVRAAFGLLIPAGLVYGAHALLLDRTNDRAFITVRRMFVGYNVILTGLVGFAALVMAFQAFFAKGPSGDPGRMFVAAMVVYVGAWVACGARFFGLVGADLGAGGPPQSMGPPAVPPAAASGGSGLPSLGGGSFPPITPP